MTRTAKTLLVIVAMTAGYACNNKTPTDARNEAFEAQREADKTALEARRAADNQVNNSVGEANKDVGKATDEAREKVAKAQAGANDKIREANREVMDKQAELKQWGQKQLDEVNHLIDDAKVKAQTAAPKARVDFNSAIHDIELRRDALQTELASLEARADTTYDKAKDALNGRIDQLKDRIKQIERML